MPCLVCVHTCCTYLVMWVNLLSCTHLEAPAALSLAVLPAALTLKRPSPLPSHAP
jgi:hypothetical protein